jgi:hypothetical protein
MRSNTAATDFMTAACAFMLMGIELVTVKDELKTIASELMIAGYALKKMPIPLNKKRIAVTSITY